MFFFLFCFSSSVRYSWGKSSYTLKKYNSIIVLLLKTSTLHPRYSAPVSRLMKSVQCECMRAPQLRRADRVPHCAPWRRKGFQVSREVCKVTDILCIALFSLAGKNRLREWGESHRVFQKTKRQLYCPPSICSRVEFQAASNFSPAQLYPLPKIQRR